MGKSYRRLKEDNRNLRAQLHLAEREAKSVAVDFVRKHSIKPGDLVVFRTDSLGTSFGYGVSALQNMERILCETAGGKVVTMATRSTFTVENLTAKDQQALRAALDKLDDLRKAAVVKPVAPESPQYRECGHLTSLTLLGGLHAGECGPCYYEKNRQAELEKRRQEAIRAAFQCDERHSSGARCEKTKDHVATDKWHEGGSRKWYNPTRGSLDTFRALFDPAKNAAESGERAPDKVVPLMSSTNDVYRYCFYCGRKMKATSVGAFQRVICEPCVVEGKT